MEFESLADILTLSEIKVLRKVIYNKFPLWELILIFVVTFGTNEENNSEEYFEKVLGKP